MSSTVHKNPLVLTTEPIITDKYNAHVGVHNNMKTKSTKWNERRPYSVMNRYIDALDVKTKGTNMTSAGNKRRKKYLTYVRHNDIDFNGLHHLSYLTLLERCARYLITSPKLIHKLVEEIDKQILIRLEGENVGAGQGNKNKKKQMQRTTLPGKYIRASEMWDVTTSRVGATSKHKLKQVAEQQRLAAFKKHEAYLINLMSEGDWEEDIFYDLEDEGGDGKDGTMKLNTGSSKKRRKESTDDGNEDDEDEDEDENAGRGGQDDDEGESVLEGVGDGRRKGVDRTKFRANGQAQQSTRRRRRDNSITSLFKRAGVQVRFFKDFDSLVLSSDHLPLFYCSHAFVSHIHLLP